MLAELLSDDGYTVRSAADGTEAPKSLRSWRPDAIVLDVRTPRVDATVFRAAPLGLPDRGPIAEMQARAPGGVRAMVIIASVLDAGQGATTPRWSPNRAALQSRCAHQMTPDPDRSRRLTAAQAEDIRRRRQADARLIAAGALAVQEGVSTDVLRARLEGDRA